MNFDLNYIIRLILFPIVGAGIGWFTNWLAIKMLFKPRQPVRVLFWTFQGVVAKKRGELAKRIAETVETDLLSADDFTEMLEKANIKEEVAKIVDNYVEQKILDPDVKTLSGRITHRYVIGFKERLKGYLTDQINANVEDILVRFMDGIEEKFNVRAIIEQRINEFDLDTLERVVFGFSSRELKTIERLGGVLGFAIGLVQAAISVLMRVA